MGADKIRFYHDEPLFGLDIGHSSIKAMQIERMPDKQPQIRGYGMSFFAPEAIQNGIIAKPEILADAFHQLFEKNLVGKITSRRVACTLPTAYMFSRPMKIPVMNHEQIMDAVHLEAEQYIPIPLDSLYIDYEVSYQDAQNMEILLVAASRKIVDSYMNLLQSLELEPVAFEPSISASSRLLKITGDASAEPSILIDMGSIATDIAIFDKTLQVSSNVTGGSDTLTAMIAKALRVSPEQAMHLKNQYGIAYSDKQQRIIDAVKPQLDNLIREIEKSQRYYIERADKSGRKITRVITIGGGAVMPGLNQYISKQLRLPTENLEPWSQISFDGLPQPEVQDRSMYITVAGEAILDPKEVMA
jgi:type IV pilus assembly protein PilM